MAGFLKKMRLKRNRSRQETANPPAASAAETKNAKTVAVPKLENLWMKLEFGEEKKVDGPGDWEENIRFLGRGASGYIALYPLPGKEREYDPTQMDALQYIAGEDEDEKLLQLRVTTEKGVHFYRRDGIAAENALDVFRDYAAGRLDMGRWKEIPEMAFSGAVLGGTGVNRWENYRMQQEDALYGGRDCRDLPYKIVIDMEKVQSLTIWTEGEMIVYPKDELIQEMILGAFREVKTGFASRIAIDFVFQGEGVYVKKLNKKVYRPFTSTLVLHGGGEKFGLAFFAGDTAHCSLLIGNYYPYVEVDSEEVNRIPVGDVMLPEYGVVSDWKSIDKALRYLFKDLETADKRISDSKLWSTDNFAGGAKRLEKMRKEWGGLEG